MILNSKWRLYFSLAALLIYFFPTKSYSSEGKDSLLIADMMVQIEATQALNHMYNFKFREARRQFLWLKQKYREHPLPYFLLGLNEWWKIMPNLEVERYDEQFLAYMDTSIMKAKVLYDVDTMKIEGAFFWQHLMGSKPDFIQKGKNGLAQLGMPTRL